MKRLTSCFMIVAVLLIAAASAAAFGGALIYLALGIFGAKILEERIFLWLPGSGILWIGTVITAASVWVCVRVGTVMRRAASNRGLLRWRRPWRGD